jgi:hypothetical protein
MMNRMSSNVMCLMAVDQDVFGWKVVGQEQESADQQIFLSLTAC